jgi:hypothetical protein
MMDIELKKKVLEEILAHLRESQGGELGALVKQSKEPAPAEIGMDADPAAPKDFDAKADGAIDEISADKPAIPEAAEGSPEEELSDEDLESLLKQYLS